MRFNRKGFTLVELLAVVVILGIIMMVSIPAVSKWIGRSKNESKEAQRQTLLLAAQSYAQGNSKVLPKAIGETKLIKATDLKKANYLKDDLVDAEKKSCMANSVVRIYKYDKNGYSYTAYLYCEGDTVPDEIVGIQPIIGITFTGEHLKDEVLQDVSKAGFKITIDGNKKDGKNLGIDGYTYSISAKYAGTGEIVEIFNSGNLNAGGKEKLVIEKSLGDYTNITTLSEFMVTAEAYNRDGGYKKVTANSKYGDKIPPTCGEITGQAGENQWFNTPHTITISVKCIDEANGSGCVKDVYTKSWNTEVEDDYIEIKDNAGNTTNCKVRVHHDWTKPTLTVVAYARTSDGGKGAQVGTVTANHSNSNVTLSSYTGSYGGNHWLNLSNFPYGLYFEMTASDNIHVNNGQWYYNNSGISNFNASDLETMITGSSKAFSNADNKVAVSLSADGIRRAKYTLTDLAGHSVTINIQANIDKTNPGCTSSGGSNSWTNGSRTLTGTCSDSMSGCVGNATNTFTAEQYSTTRSPGTVYDNAGNSYNCPANQTVKIDKTPPGCNYNKTIINNPNGVKIELTCYDNMSGVLRCPCHVVYVESPDGKGTKAICVIDSLLKRSTNYDIQDAAGNTASCSIIINEYTAYDIRIRSCKTCNRCRDAGCESYGSWSSYNCTNTYTSWPYGQCYEGFADCQAVGMGYKYNCRTRSCSSYYRNCGVCGCEKYNPWPVWPNLWADESCPDNDYTECRSRTQYR